MGIRSASVAGRGAIALAMALLLALRLLSPAGFMPSFDRGSVTIVAACPDMVAGPALGHHHHGSNGQHQSCPYAPVASLGGLAADITALIITNLDAATALSAGLGLAFLVRQRSRERPPSRGPPILT